MSKITVTLAGKTVEVDEEGFLENRSEWNEHVAKELARAENCELTRDHWEVIHFLRAYYDEYQTSPAARVLAKAIGKQLGPEKGTVTYLLELFPDGATRQMCKYAGLPKPGCSVLTLTLLFCSRKLKRRSHMGTTTVAGKAVEVDEDGYLKTRTDWNEVKAKQMAKFDNSTITVAGKIVQIDYEGFLVHISDWNEEVTKEIARADNFELTPAHMEVINFVREYYEQFKASPNQRLLPKAIGKKLGPDKGNNKYLYGLFPQGPAKQAGKYAGLPRPHGCP